MATDGEAAAASPAPGNGAAAASLTDPACQPGTREFEAAEQSNQIMQEKYFKAMGGFALQKVCAAESALVVVRRATTYWTSCQPQAPLASRMWAVLSDFMLMFSMQASSQGTAAACNPRCTRAGMICMLC
jgi:hypothetical protein